jgi:hypothetical protein
VNSSNDDINEGIFFIDLDSICDYFSTVHFSWVPYRLFPNKSHLHGRYVIDLYNEMARLKQSIPNIA